jgi:hypothetical protein
MCAISISLYAQILHRPLTIELFMCRADESLLSADIQLHMFFAFGIVS